MGRLDVRQAPSLYNVTVRASPQSPTLGLPDYAVYRNVNLYQLCFSQTHRPPPLTPSWYITTTTRCQEYTRSLWSMVLVIGRWFIPQVSPTRSSPHLIAHQSLLMRLIGTNLVLNIVDSESKPVGNARAVKVQATNSTKECLQPRANNTNSLELSSDIVRDLDMCSPLNIRIGGGQKPYTVSLVPIRVAPTINITLGANDDSLFWVNLLVPNTTLVVTASDRSVPPDV